MMEFTAEHVEKAVSHFYQNMSTQSQLNMWLTSAQSSNQAWIFSWQLLDQSKPIEVQYFGASSLQVKISKYWHEIPPDQYTVLRDKLTSTLVAYSCGPKLVLTRLCFALSSFIIHSIPEKWTNPLSDVLSMLQQLSGPGRLQPQFITLLLEILTYLPEEFQEMKLSHERRIAVRSELLSAAKDVLPILKEVICGVDESAAEAGVKCLSSWIQHGVGIGLEECVQLIEPILAVARNENLCHEALDAVINLVNHPEAQRFPNLLMSMLAQLLTLQDLLHSSRREGDLVRAAQIYTVFTAFGESHSRLLLDAVMEGGSKKDNVLQLVQILLESTSTPGRYHIDENCSHLAFSFWYILQDDICGAIPEKHKVYTELFGPAYLALVDILMTKSMMVDESEWSAEDRETFRCYRQDISDTLAYCYKFLRSTMMQRLVSHFAATITQSNRCPESWPQLEACLHALKAVAENVEAEEDQMVPQILSLFSNFQFTGHRHVVNTALETLGAYAEWLSAHPAYLGHVLPILIFGLSNPEAAPAATMALKDITRDCQMGIRPYAETLLQACEQAIILEDLKANEKVRLMYILGKVLSVLPLDVIVASLNRVVGPCVDHLRSLCSKLDPDATTKGQLITRLKMIATLCTTLDLRVTGEESEDDSGLIGQQKTCSTSQQPVLLIAQQLLPLLNGIVERWGADEQIVESICLVIKHTVSTLMDEAILFLPELASVVVHCHRLSPQSATLDVAKLILLMFPQTQGDTQNLLRAFLSEIIGTTLQICGVSGTLTPEGVPVIDATLLADNTEVLASFFTLMSQLLRKTPLYVSGCSSPLSSLFYCGIVGLTRPESQTFKAATQYLVHFVTQSRDNPELVAVVQSQGQLLVNQALRCIGGESPRAYAEHMADIILALNKKYFDNLCRWLNLALARENFPTPLVTFQYKENFCRMVLKERSNKRRLQDIVREFSLHCRGLIGTEYSEQMTHILP